MKIRKTLQASVHLTIDERKTLENAIDLLIDMAINLKNLAPDFEGTMPENIVTMEDDVKTACYRLKKILTHIEE